MPLPNDINHLAILMPSWLGDVVMASNVWRVARLRFPNVKITAVIRPHLAPLLRNVPEIDEVLPLDMKASVFQAGKKLRTMGADAIVLLPNSIRSALIAKLSGIPVRCGYRRDWRSWLLTESIPVTKTALPTPTSEYYLHLINTLCNTNEAMAPPSLSGGEVTNFFEQFTPPIVLLVAGASKEQKRWAPKNFAKVADALTKQGATCFGIGSPDEFDLVEQIVSSSTAEVHNVTRSGIDLSSLPSLIAQANLMITNDTGPRHIAVATNTPVVTLYGPTDFRWTTYETENDIPVLADPFLPEEFLADNNPQRCNINAIPASDVIAIAQQFLK